MSATKHKRIDRSAFLYLGDRSNKQCDQCCFFTPEHRCSVIKGHPQVEPKWSCGLFVPGKYSGEPTGGAVSLEEAGLVKYQVRCENCEFAEDGECGLYHMLNERLPAVFELDPEIHPYACCNGFEPKKGKPIKRAKGGRVEESNIDHAPSPAQAEAGNYKKDRLHVHGLPITIENARGSIRRGVGADDKPWQCRLPAHYGYVRKTQGADSDPVDCYLGPHRKAPNVYVIDQIDAKTGSWDEHKAMLFFGSEKQALAAYAKAFSDGKGTDRIGHVATMPIAQFKHWLATADTSKPIGYRRADGGPVTFDDRWQGQGGPSFAERWDAQNTPSLPVGDAGIRGDLPLDQVPDAVYNDQPTEQERAREHAGGKWFAGRDALKRLGIKDKADPLMPDVRRVGPQGRT